MSERCRAICLLLVTAAVLCLAGCAAQEGESPPENPSELPPKAGDVRINAKDGAEMVWIPAGEFLMGSTDEDIAQLVHGNSKLKAEWLSDEKPQRKVFLDGYWIYKNPVTVAQYRKFCTSWGRRMPAGGPRFLWKEDGSPIAEDTLPITCVSWQDAADYGRWAGASLPTEAQWEKAARGTDGRTYPWGEEWPPTKAVGNLPDQSRARAQRTVADLMNEAVDLLLGEQGSVQEIIFRSVDKDEGLCSGYDDGYAMTSPIGSFPAGASPYGCLDMAGNVWEWCADWYTKDYYASGPLSNPTGPTGGGSRVLRGGSWDYERSSSFRCANRLGYSPDFRISSGGMDISYYCTVGFRCVSMP